MRKHIFLTYNEWWNDGLHKSTDIEHRGLTAEEVQKAIDLYWKQLLEV